MLPQKALFVSNENQTFFTEVLFAGARVGSQGICPNLDKVRVVVNWPTLVVNWPTPETVQQLMGFFGLANHFRQLISDYARIVAPLTDLTRVVKIEQPTGSG